MNAPRSTRSSVRRVSSWAGADAVEDGHSARGGIRLRRSATSSSSPCRPCTKGRVDRSWRAHYIARRLTIPPADVYGWRRSKRCSRSSRARPACVTGGALRPHSGDASVAIDVRRLRDLRPVQRTQADCFSARASSCSSVSSVRSGCASSMWLRAFASNSTSVSPLTLWPQKQVITHSPGSLGGRPLSTEPIMQVPRGSGELVAPPWSPHQPRRPRAWSSRAGCRPRRRCRE